MSDFARVGHDGPIRIVQVGAGGMGRAWLRTIDASPEVELVGLVDLDVDTARRALSEERIPGGVAIGTSVSDVAAATAADAVVNVTVPAAHLPVNLEAFAAGLPVLCEKPAAPTIRDAYRQAAASRASGQLLMISQSRRYFAALDAVRAQLSSVGAVSSVSTRFFREAHFPGFRQEMEHPLLIDMAIHQFDAARSIIGAAPVSVYCEEHNRSGSWYRGAADAHAIFAFEGGARYVFTGSWIAVGEQTAWNGEWRVDGERGSIRWDGAADVRFTSADMQDVSEALAVADGAPEETAGSLREFVASLRTGERPSNIAEENILSLGMVFAATLSAETGVRVDIGDFLERAREEAIAAERDDAIRAELQRL